MALVLSELLRLKHGQPQALPAALSPFKYYQDDNVLGQFRVLVLSSCTLFSKAKIDQDSLCLGQVPRTENMAFIRLYNFSNFQW